jgi:hypothetical protein
MPTQAYVPFHCRLAVRSVTSTNNSDFYTLETELGHM